MKQAWPRKFNGTTRFRLLRKLGEGGMGSVYEAEDLERNERVAIKLLHRTDADALRRFKNEYRALQDLEHPNLVRLGELHEDDGLWFFSMELVPGVDLCEFVSGARAENDGSRKHFDEPRLRSAFRQLAEGVEALHAAGKIHCDIKPSNVRVTPTGRVVLLDFGLIFERKPSRVDTDDRILGTAAYMAPEQISDEGVCFASDWYAFGVVLYEALTGVVPFNGGGFQVLMDKLHMAPVPPRVRAPHVPAELDELCCALLSVHSEERPQGSDVLRLLGAGESRTRASLPYASTPPWGERSVFVGRGQELAALATIRREALRGQPSIVSIEGASGLGKSTLLSHFLERSRREDARLIALRGRCYERETARFKALDGVVDALATELCRLPVEERRDIVPRNAALLRRLFPVLGRVDTIARAPDAHRRPRDSVEERALMFSALRELLARLGQKYSLIIAIDDMQWADGDSLELLRALVDPARGPVPRMLVVVTAREAWIRGIDDDSSEEDWPGHVQVLPLGTLPDEDTELLAEQLLTRLGAKRVATSALVREARGHPLFVAELAWLAHHRERDPHTALTLDEAIWTRASSLPKSTLSVLTLLSVAAVPVRARLLSQALRVSPTEIDRHLAALRLDALAKSVGQPDALKVEPHHDRVREALLQKLDRQAQREIHGLLAPLLEQEPDADPELVAQHYLDAGNKEKAGELFAKAAHRAEDGLAFERAALLYRAQLGLGVSTPEEQSTLQQQLAHALVRAGRGKAAAEAYMAALAGAPERDHVRIQNAAATCLLRSGHVAEGLAALEAVLHSVGVAMPATHLRAILALVWERIRLLGGYHVRYREGEIPGAELQRADALFAVAQGLSLVDGVRCAPVAAQALRAALKTGERTRVVKALSGEVSLLALGGARMRAGAERALTVLKQAVEPCTDPVLHGYVLGSEATLAVSNAEFQKSYELANRALELFDTPGCEAQWERSYVRSFRIFAQFYLGRMREMYDEGEVALRDADMRRDRWYASLLRIGPVSLGAVDQDLALARSLSDEGFAPFRERSPGFLFWCWFTKCVVLDLVEDRWESALARYTEHEKAVWQSGSWFLPMLRAHLCSYRAIALLQGFRAQGDITRLKEADHWIKKMGSENALIRGWALLLSAQVAEARSSDAAVTLVQRANEAFTSCGADRFLHMAQAYEGRLVGGDRGRELSQALDSYFMRERLEHWDMLVKPFVPALCED